MTLNYLKRNKGIDVFRILAVLLMGFVNIVWMVGSVPHCLEHGGTMEDFLGLADFVFPCFLFSIGLSIPYAIENRLSKDPSGLNTVFHILSRAFALIVMGVFIYNAESELSSSVDMSSTLFEILAVVGLFLVWASYPKESKLKFLRYLGIALLIYLSLIYRGRSHGDHETVFRSGWWGILGILGWTYLVSAFLYLALRNNVKKFSIAFALLFLLCIFLSKSHLGIIEDRFDFPVDKYFLYSLLQVFNIPPGSHLTICVAGILTSLVSWKIEPWKFGRKVTLVVVSATVLFATGILLHKFWIVSKNLATPPTVCFNLCAALCFYALFQFLESKAWCSALEYLSGLGSCALTCYMVQAFMTEVLAVINPPVGSFSGLPAILYCLSFSIICLIITGFLKKKGIRLKL